MKGWTYSKETRKGIHLKTGKIIRAFTGAIAMAALIAVMPIVATSCGDKDTPPPPLPIPTHPQYEDVTLTGGFVSYAGELSIRKSYGLVIDDAHLLKICGGFATARTGSAAFNLYMNGKKLNITINGGSAEPTAADGCFVIGKIWIDLHTAADIKTAIWDYARTELGVLCSLNKGFDKSNAVLKQRYIAVHEGKIYGA